MSIKKIIFSALLLIILGYGCKKSNHEPVSPDQTTIILQKLQGSWNLGNTWFAYSSKSALGGLDGILRYRYHFDEGHKLLLDGHGRFPDIESTYSVNYEDGINYLHFNDDKGIGHKLKITSINDVNFDATEEVTYNPAVNLSGNFEKDGSPFLMARKVVKWGAGDHTNP